MLGEGVERVCQPTGRRAGDLGQHLAPCGRSPGARRPPPCARAFSQRQPWQEISWPRFDGVLDQPGRQLGRPAAGADGGRHAEPLQRIGDAPPRGLGAVLEVRFHAAVGDARDLVGDLVDLLVEGIAGGERHLRAFLEVDDEGDGDARAARPLRIGRRAAVAFEVTQFTMPDHVGERLATGLWSPSAPAGDRCRRSPCADSCAPAPRP